MTSYHKTSANVDFIFKIFAIIASLFLVTSVLSNYETLYRLKMPMLVGISYLSLNNTTIITTLDLPFECFWLALIWASFYRPRNLLPLLLILLPFVISNGIDQLISMLGNLQLLRLSPEIINIYSTITLNIFNLALAAMFIITTIIYCIHSLQATDILHSHLKERKMFVNNSLPSHIAHGYLILGIILMLAEIAMHVQSIFLHHIPILHEPLSWFFKYDVASVLPSLLFATILIIAGLKVDAFICSMTLSLAPFLLYTSIVGITEFNKPTTMLIKLISTLYLLTVVLSIIAYFRKWKVEKKLIWQL